jgi:hypothetical protein
MSGKNIHNRVSFPLARATHSNAKMETPQLDLVGPLEVGTTALPSLPSLMSAPPFKNSTAQVEIIPASPFSHLNTTTSFGSQMITNAVLVFSERFQWILARFHVTGFRTTQLTLQRILTIREVLQVGYARSIGPKTIVGAS